MSCKFGGAIVLTYIVGVFTAIGALSSLGALSTSTSGAYFLANFSSLLTNVAMSVTMFMEAALFSKLSKATAQLASVANEEADPAVVPCNNMGAAPVQNQSAQNTIDPQIQPLTNEASNEDNVQ